MSGVHDENMKTIEDAIEYIRRQMWYEAQRHYDDFIFTPDYPGQTPEMKYIDTKCKYETALIERLEQMLD